MTIDRVFVLLFAGYIYMATGKGWVGIAWTGVFFLYCIYCELSKLLETFKKK